MWKALLLLIVAAGAFAETPDRPKRAAILIFNGVDIIDYAGPYEVFGQAGFDVYTVAAQAQPIITAKGMQITAKYTFENAPMPDVVIIPGGNFRTALAWIQNVLNEVDYVITTTGLASGIDRSLDVLAKMSGMGNAQLTALNINYNWQPASFTRAALADTVLKKIFTGTGEWLDHPAGVTLQLLRYEGTRSQWRVVWVAIGEASGEELLRQLDVTLETAGAWTRRHSQEKAMQSRWAFTDENGKAWSGLSTVSAFEGLTDVHTIRLEIWSNE